MNKQLTTEGSEPTEAQASTGAIEVGTFGYFMGRDGEVMDCYVTHREGDTARVNYRLPTGEVIRGAFIGWYDLLSDEEAALLGKTL